MTDFEDATSTTLDNIITGQVNQCDAIRNQIDFEAENGKSYALNAKHAVLKVRPRGWHLEKKNMVINGEPLSASLVDFGLFFFHNAKNYWKMTLDLIFIYQSWTVILRTACGTMFL